MHQGTEDTAPDVAGYCPCEGNVTHLHPEEITRPLMYRVTVPVRRGRCIGGSD